MGTNTPFFREQGAGEGVVCLHSNASSSSQWRTLSELLSGRFHVFAVDGYGAGKSPDWPGPGPVTLEDEVRLLDSVLDRAGGRFHLVGHSYGAAVAVKTAVMYPDRVRSMVLYEPTLFHLVVQGDPAASPAQGIWQAASDAADLVDAGDSAAGARRFIDFWMGNGAWDATPPARQAGITSSVRNVRAWRDTLMTETMPLAAIASLQMPVLCMCGENSPESALSVTRVLRRTLPNVVAVSLPGLGHMAPITHPELVNPRIAEFLAGGVVA
jgi:pimeloyl-ACP methyl ester carboxylesterase